jgi:hypothetical protein
VSPGVEGSGHALSKPVVSLWNLRVARQFALPLCIRPRPLSLFAEDARRILKIGTWYNTVEETLFNLGLPPNRPEGQKGFLVYDTEGRVPKAAAATGSDPTQIIAASTGLLVAADVPSTVVLKTTLKNVAVLGLLVWYWTKVQYTGAKTSVYVSPRKGEHICQSH